MEKWFSSEAVFKYRPLFAFGHRGNAVVSPMRKVSWTECEIKGMKNKQCAIAHHSFPFLRSLPAVSTSLL